MRSYSMVRTGRPMLVFALLSLVGCGVAASRRASSRPDLAVDVGQADDTPRAALSRFVGAIQAEEWATAYALLSAHWRGVLTPARLASDYASSGPVGRAAADRVRALLSASAPLPIEKETAVLQVGEGRSAVLLLEGGAWRVDALE